MGIAVGLTHSAATPPGFTVTVRGKLEKIEKRKLSFSVSADDGIDQISAGTHERFVIDVKKFNDKIWTKIDRGAYRLNDNLTSI